MTIKLEKLISRGVGQPDAEIEFRDNGTLIRGPSDTGKSYIRDCLWYMLGGDKVPKEIPQSKNYNTLLLQFRYSDGGTYTVSRSLSGGGSEVFAFGISELERAVPLPDDIGELLVGLSGAKEKLILRSMSKRGPMTGGDLRHWFLISQPAMISEDSTTGVPTEQSQRRAAFCVFLTGQDDSSIILAPTKEEKLKVKTAIASIERDLKRVAAEIPEETTKNDVKGSLERIDNTLTLLSQEQIERSKELRGIRDSLNAASSKVSVVESKLAYSVAMFNRFSLLDKKYASDLDRLGTMGDGVAIFEILESQPCALCGTPIEQQVDNTLLSAEAASKQRVAMGAEAKKIIALRDGLAHTLEREREQISIFKFEVESAQVSLRDIASQEKQALSASSLEFSADPKALAIVRSEIYSQIKLFDEMERLSAEHQRLLNITPSKTAPILRMTNDAASDVAVIVQSLLHAWGLIEIKSIELDAIECDIKIDGRSRLSYGAGKRAIFLSALAVALLQHAMTRKFPHLGMVVLDSPIKSYSDPKNIADVTASPVTVRDLFYEWLANWTGPGQVIVLENEPILDDTAKQLSPIEFSGQLTGRQGFYPIPTN